MNRAYPFVQSIQINKVRHLKDIQISIDNDRPRHLILTGPNGCGKTSVLRFLKDYLEGIPSRNLLQVDQWRNSIRSWEQAISQIDENLKNPYMASSDQQIAQWQSEKSNLQQYIINHTNIIQQYESLKPSIAKLPELVEAYHRGEFLISFFDAKRIATIQAVQGAQKLELPKISPIDASAGSSPIMGGSLSSRFMQFLVNQDTLILQLRRRGKEAEAQAIEDWFKLITQKFRDLFQNDNLELDYDFNNYDFKIKIPGREPFGLVNNQLSDGFSSVIQIVAELLLRMEAVSRSSYDMPGVVLIDEIETHLHLELQKAILPFLTGFFPNIQFIVTTHSPFVLTSLPDAVIFDLESHKREENLAPLSASTVVEEYFDSDLYSKASKKLITRYSVLAKLESRTENEQEELLSLREKLDLLEYDDSPDLVAHYQFIRAQEAHK